MALLSGCVSAGNQAILNQSNVAQIKEGVSTKADVKAAVGEPMNITPIPGGEVWQYSGGKLSMSPLAFIPVVGLVALASGNGVNRQNNDLWVLFDNEGIVRKLEYGKVTPKFYAAPFYGKVTAGPRETLRSTSGSPPLDQPQTTQKSLNLQNSEGKVTEGVTQSKVMINPDTGELLNIRPEYKQRGFVEIEKLPSVGIKLPKNDNAENGIIIEGVYPGSPAAKAGLKAGDMIVEKNGQPINTLSELKSQRRLKMGDIVEYKIIRGEREMVLSLKTVPFADIVKAK